MQSDESPSVADPLTIWVVAFVALLYGIFPALIMQLLMAAGFGPPIHGEPNAEQMVQLSRLGLIAGALAFPLQIASVVFLVPHFAGVRLEQIGLTTRRLGRSCLWGLGGWLTLTPICMALYCGVVSLEEAAGASNVQQHPLVELAQQGLSPWELLLFIAAVTVTAPVMEEIVFRGAVQSWLEKQPLGAPLVLILALLFSLPTKKDAWITAWQNGVGSLMLHCAPILFIIALSLIYGIVYRLSRTSAWPALFASSMLFAAVHSFAWPSPIPLFVLALGLGWVAQRTRSLAGPMILHGLFNAVNCVIVFWHY